MKPSKNEKKIIACTISRDLREFDLLIDDIDIILGKYWADVTFENAKKLLEINYAQELEFILIAVDARDQDNFLQIADIVDKAKLYNIKTIIAAAHMDTSLMNQLLCLGVDHYIPYPAPRNLVTETISLLRERTLLKSKFNHQKINSSDPDYTDGKNDHTSRATKNKDDNISDTGFVMSMQGLSGGVGTTTIIVNLAWELATILKFNVPKVCLIDLDIQHGSVAQFLGLPQSEATTNILTETDDLTVESLMHTMQKYSENLYVFSSPKNMLYLDDISPALLFNLIGLARKIFDYVIIDTPKNFVDWTKVIIDSSDMYFSIIEMEARCKQNIQRLKQFLHPKDENHSKIQYILNRAPKATDFIGKRSVKNFSEDLGISIDVQLPDGGTSVQTACNEGFPLKQLKTTNSFRKEIFNLAHMIRDSKTPAGHST